MKLIPLRGLCLLGGTTLLTLAVILGEKALLKSFQLNLTPELPEEKLWKVYRWSISPNKRREAALILVSKSMDSPKRVKRLLIGQGWGNDPIAAISLKLQGQVNERLGASDVATNFWKELLTRFPFSPSSSDAYYYLGRKDILIRRQLLKRHPGHPASLASAYELAKQYKSTHEGVMHLARWGIRWPGAGALIRAACNNSSKAIFHKDERQELAHSLALLGDVNAAINCLRGNKPSPILSLIIGKGLLGGSLDEIKKGESILSNLIKDKPLSSESLEAVNILSESLKPNIGLLDSFPKELTNQSSSLAVLKVRLDKGLSENSVLSKWADDPAIWQLQWDLAREALLNKQWEKAKSLLDIIPINKLPGPIVVRQKFWKGYILAKQGKAFEAKRIWADLIGSHPGGYYSWRASERLGLGGFPILLGKPFEKHNPVLIKWEQLESKKALVNHLWRLGLTHEAWEHWRALTFKPFQEIDDPKEKLVEARLRLAVGDEWMALLMLHNISLRMVGEDCQTRLLLHRSQHPYRFLSEINSASRKTGVRPELLLAIANQESRFALGVESSAGAVGLMQVLPETARELETSSLTKNSIKEPMTNLLLGARYLAGILELWEGNPLLAVASYNAGPRQVKAWLSSEINSEPEIWVEKIPYPETRFYTKKVLGNLWSYLHLNLKRCQADI